MKELVSVSFKMSDGSLPIAIFQEGDNSFVLTLADKFSTRYDHYPSLEDFFEACLKVDTLEKNGSRCFVVWSGRPLTDLTKLNPKENNPTLLGFKFREDVLESLKKAEPQRAPEPTPEEREQQAQKAAQAADESFRHAREVLEEQAREEERSLMRDFPNLYKADIKAFSPLTQARHAALVREVDALALDTQRTGVEREGQVAGLIVCAKELDEGIQFERAQARSLAAPAAPSSRLTLTQRVKAVFSSAVVVGRPSPATVCPKKKGKEESDDADGPGIN